MSKSRLASLLTLSILTAPEVGTAENLHERINEAHVLLEETWGNGVSRAREQLEEALESTWKSGDRRAEAAVRVGLGRLRARGFDGVGALAHLELAQEFYDSGPTGETPTSAEGVALASAMLALGFGEAYRALGEFEAARDSLEQALKLAQPLENGTRLAAAAHLVLADLDELEEAFDGALAHLEAGSVAWRAIGEIRHARQAELEKGKLLHRLGQYREAIVILERLIDKPPAVVDREAIRAYLNALLQPSDAVTSLAGAFFAAVTGSGADFAAAQTDELSTSKISLELRIPNAFQDVAYFERRTAIEKRRLAALIGVPKPEPPATRQIPISAAIEERLIRDCAELHRRHETDNQAIVDWLVENVPGFTWHRQCEGSFRSRGALPANCPPSVLAFQTTLWDVDLAWRLECGSERKGFSADSVRDLYSDFGIDEEILLGSSGFRKPDFRADPMPEPFASMFTTRSSGNPFEEYFNRVDRQHEPALELLFDLTLELETWNALGHARKRLKRPASQVAEAYQNAWKASEPIWSSLPVRMGFSASHLEDIRASGLSINAFKRRPGPWASLNWGSFLFDVGRQSLWQGQIHLMRGRPLLAAAFFRQAVDVQDSSAPSHFNPEIKLAAQTGLGRAFHEMKLPAAAVLTYQEAIDLAESLRGSLDNQGSSMSFADTQASLYERLIDLLVDLGDSDLAFAYAERARARAFLDLLSNQRLDLRFIPDEIDGEWDALRRELLALQDQGGQAQGQEETHDLIRLRRLEVEQRLRELNAEIRRLHPEAASLVDSSPLPLEFLRDRVVEDDTTLVVYFATDTKVLAWAIEAGSSYFRELPIEPSALDEIEFLRRLIADVDVMTAELKDEVAITLEEFYAGLIAPLKPKITGTRLLIVPHGPLHWLPFAALRDGPSGRYLIEETSLTLLPSASVLPYVQQRRDAAGSRLLILGNPDGSLEFADREAEAIAALYGAEPRTGARATESIVHRLAPEVDVLHLAAHGDFHETGALSGFIELAPGEPAPSRTGDPSADGRLQVLEVFNDLDLSAANLVVLSACESSVGGQSLGDDVVSMPRAFLYAGAPSVISTLWSIQDDSSAELMHQFHQVLRRGVAVDEALRAAQREMLGREDTEFPYFWAGFTLSGDSLGWGEPPALAEPPPLEPAVVRGKLRRKLRPSTRSMRAQMRLRSPRAARQRQPIRRSTLGTGWPPPESALSAPPPSVRHTSPDFPERESSEPARQRLAVPERRPDSLPQLPNPPRPSSSGGGVTLFEHGDFEGRRETFFEDQPDLRNSVLGQDAASSVKVATGCRAVLYRHIYYEGRSTVVEGALASLRGSKVGNDEVSSLEIQCQ